jgi:hypothetical protein
MGANSHHAHTVQLMSRILIDEARCRLGVKRGWSVPGTRRHRRVDEGP